MQLTKYKYSIYLNTIKHSKYGKDTDKYEKTYNRHALRYRRAYIFKRPSGSSPGKRKERRGRLHIFNYAGGNGKRDKLQKE